MDEGLFNTIRWAITIGVNRGYALEGQKQVPEETVIRLFQKIAEEVFSETGVYVSAVCVPSRALYRSEWGCPPGGEFAYSFSGSCNPAFAEKDGYTKALMKVAQKMKEELSQATLLLEIVPAHLEYFRDNIKEGEDG